MSKDPKELEQMSETVQQVQYMKAKRGLSQEIEIEQQQEAQKLFSYKDAAKEKLRRHQEYESVKTNRTKPFFISNLLTQVLNLAAGTLALVCMTTGKGKTTTSVNAVLRALEKGLRVMYVSNEETLRDFIHKLASLKTSLNPNKSDLWSSNDLKRYEEAKSWLLNCEFLTIIDDDFETSTGGRLRTSTVSGIEQILSEVRSNNDVDLFILDYFQNISSELGQGSEYDALKKLCKKLDFYKNKIGCPIVVFAQLKPITKNEPEFEKRIKDCKDIFVKSTVAIEGFADKKNRINYWKIHKLRESFGGVFVEDIVFRMLWHNGVIFDTTDENILRLGFVKCPKEKDSEFDYDIKFKMENET